MPTLWRRRYGRRLEAVGLTEKLAGGVILWLVVGVVVAFVMQVSRDRGFLFTMEPETPRADQEAATADTVQLESPFPDAGLADWRVPERIERFAADELYVKIDGRADAFLKFHVVSLIVGTYRHRGDPERSVDVYWYDMGSEDNAIGMYEFEAPPGTKTAVVGKLGYQAGSAVFFCQGSAYVQVLPNGPDDAAAGMAIARCLAERLRK